MHYSYFYFPCQAGIKCIDISEYCSEDSMITDERCIHNEWVEANCQESCKICGGLSLQSPGTFVGILHNNTK